MGLYKELREYSNSDFYPFHMPGHKRNFQNGSLSEMYQVDITEIDGFDDLHQPESVIQDAQRRAAQFYHSQETYFLINGSTAGILSAISSVAHNGDTLLIARNCHKAVYHAAFLNRMKVRYVYPESNLEYDIAGEISAEKIKKEIDTVYGGNNKAERLAGVVITSPTYDGISSDVRKIAELVHSYGIPLIVDQAHGAHFGIHQDFPDHAVCQGADLVIHSVHKTLPAPTQTALLHKNGSLVDCVRLKKYLRIFQSSSPSYPLMAGIDEAISLAQTEGEKRLSLLLKYRDEFIHDMEGCRYIRICPDTEPGKLVISVKNSSMTGRQLYNVLRERYHLQMEMACGTYVLAILSMMDTSEGIKRLSKALCEIDEELSSLHQKGLSLPYLESMPVKSMELWESYSGAYEEKELCQSQGRVAAEFVNLYPPGIPLLVPGEVITGQLISMIRGYQENGYTVQGINNQKIKVITSK